MPFLKSLFGKKEEEIGFIGKNKIVLFLISDKLYQAQLGNIAKKVADASDKIIYVSLNKPAKSMIETLNKKNIDIKKFLFIDAVSKGMKTGDSGKDIMLINSPKNFGEFEKQLNQILETEKFQYLIFDSVNMLLMYQNEGTVTRFIHDLVAKVLVLNANAEIVCWLDNIKPSLVKHISVFADRVIDLSSAIEIKIAPEGKEADRENRIAKLQNELEAVKQAYDSNLLSREAHLKATERIQHSINRLRSMEERVSEFFK